MPTLCCVPECMGRGGHKFPSDTQLKDLWLIAIRRGERKASESTKWKPTAHSVVCRAHFQEEDYTTHTYYGTQPSIRRLKNTAVPTIFNWSKKPSPADTEKANRLKERSLKKEGKLSCTENIVDTGPVGAEVVVCAGDVFTGSIDGEEAGVSVTIEASTQTDCSANACHCYKSVKWSISNFKDDDAAIHFYTGLENYSKFTFVLSSLGSAAYSLSYHQGALIVLPVEDQFFCCLIKLRQHKTNFELSRMFGVTERAVSSIFVTWVNFMSLQWGELSWWPDRDLVKFYSPADFKLKFPTTRVIIDGTEFPVFKPKDPLKQQSTFSTYKNRNTVKCLIGSTPGGLISYVSPAYGGSTSDRQICERSSLYEDCDLGDSIMADKGFNVQDLFEAKQVFINIPTFFKKTNQLSGQTILRDRKIASKRVHIERLIGLGKTYKILTSAMNGTEVALASDIVKICYYLCNFRNCIVSKSA